jgi:hypothetical protein
MNRIPFPYAIPDEYIVKQIPEKTRVFAELTPSFGGKATYKFGPGQQAEYYKHYQTSRFAHTKKKGGWDCLRHYEILMNGCIPVFEGLEKCPSKCLVFFPKELVLKANKELLPWEETPEKIKLYTLYAEKLLAHCRQFCTISALTRWFFSNMPHLTDSTGQPKKDLKILLVTCATGENYTRELFSIGLRRALGSNFVDSPKNEVLYKSCDLSNKYGNGYTYGGLLDDDLPVDRSNILERIKAHEFDSILFGPIGRDEGHLGTFPTIPYIQEVMQVYKAEEIGFLYGGDGTQDMQALWNQYTKHLLGHEWMARCFVRELDDPTCP